MKSCKNNNSKKHQCEYANSKIFPKYFSKTFLHFSKTIEQQNPKIFFCSQFIRWVWFHSQVLFKTIFLESIFKMEIVYNFFSHVLLMSVPNGVHSGCGQSTSRADISIFRRSFGRVLVNISLIWLCYMASFGFFWTLLEIHSKLKLIININHFLRISSQL